MLFDVTVGCRQAAQLDAYVTGIGAKHEDAVRERDRLFDIVRDDQHRSRRDRPFRPELLQLLPEILARQHVERREGLVEKQHLGVDDQRACEADTLLHAAR